MYSVFRVRDFQKGDPGVSSTSSRGTGWIKPSAKPQETSSRSKLPDLEGLMLRIFRDLQTELKQDSEIRKYVILLVLDATAGTGMLRPVQILFWDTSQKGSKEAQ